MTSFVSYLFVRMGFGFKWKKWMKSYVEYTTYSILVNVSPTTPIAARGLRHRDPLFPFIFTLVGEDLNMLIDKAKDLGIVKGFRPVSGVGNYTLAICR